MPTIMFLPNHPAWIQGIANIRSEIVSVIDFGGFLNLVVLRHKKLKIGIRLDQIIGTVSKTASEIIPLDLFDKNPVDTCLFSSGLFIEKNFYYILKVPRLLTAPRLLNYNSNG